MGVNGSPRLCLGLGRIGPLTLPVSPPPNSPSYPPLPAPIHPYPLYPPLPTPIQLRVPRAACDGAQG